VTVYERAVSGSVATRWRGALAYVSLLVQLLWRQRRYGVINLQFSGWWPAEVLMLAGLRRRLVFTVHNAVPHGFGAMQHGPTRWLARLAHALVFVSESTRDDFMRRYGEGFRAKSHVLPHGLLPIAPEMQPVAYTPQAAARSLVFWSRVQPYKGVELFAQLARSPHIRAAGLSLEIYGAWVGELLPLKNELSALGVHIEDGYLDKTKLLALLSKEAVFLLPYQQASQSGALYSLLSHGRVFICTDVGDLGAFMRRFGLEGLLMRERNAEAVAECLRYLAAHRDEVLRRLQAAQQECRWERVIDAGARLYGLRSSSPSVSA
jgi:glycosyltransferase involved in cell wall biosynthesis